MSYQPSQGFQEAFDYGMGAVNRQMAAKGMRNSGNALAELTRYGTGAALADFGQDADRQQRDRIADQHFTLGQESNANTRHGNDQNFGLGMYRAGNDFSLGQQQNNNTGQNNWWQYDLGRERNSLAGAHQENEYNMGWGRNAVDWMNADTNRGNALSRDYARQMELMQKNGGW